MTSGDERERGRLFNEVPALYEQVRPSYPDELFAELVAVTGSSAVTSQIDPSIGWARAHSSLRPGGRLALLGHVVVRRADEPEVYAATADLHEHFAPGNPDWGHPPAEDEVRATSTGWGPPNEDRGGLFGPTVVRWYPTVQHFDGAGFADLLRTSSMYRRLDASVREPFLDEIAQRIRTDLGDRATRRYLTVLRVGQRTP